MGVDVTVLDFLMKYKEKLTGTVLQLGRQGLHISSQNANNIVQKYDPAGHFGDIVSSTGFTENLFRYLGATKVIAMDASKFEGAEIVHDLNLPVPRNLWNSFETIFDGGTIEHVFNVPTALENVKRMLKKGGVFLSVNAANNQLGHGFYQFSPELMWRVFSNVAGYNVELMQIAVLSDAPAPINMPDPAAHGTRLEIGVTWGPTYLLVAARKLFESNSATPVQQSDYLSMWKSAEIAKSAVGKGRAKGTGTRKKRFKASKKKAARKPLVRRRKKRR